MKKTLLALIALASMFVACGGNTTEKASVNDSDSVEVESTVVADSVITDSVFADSVVVAE